MLPKDVERAARSAAAWVKDLTDDWIVVKEEILNELPNGSRSLFTRRDGKLKEVRSLNEMELEIVALWKELTGVQLLLRPYDDRKTRWWKPPWEDALDEP